MIAAARKVAAALRAGPMSAEHCIALLACLAWIPALFILIAEVLS